MARLLTGNRRCDSPPFSIGRAVPGIRRLRVALRVGQSRHEPVLIVRIERLRDLARGLAVLHMRENPRHRRKRPVSRVGVRLAAQPRVTRDRPLPQDGCVRILDGYRGLPQLHLLALSNAILPSLKSGCQHSGVVSPSVSEGHERQELPDRPQPFRRSMRMLGMWRRPRLCRGRLRRRSCGWPGRTTRRWRP